VSHPCGRRLLAGAFLRRQSVGHMIPSPLISCITLLF
jgi:hypothetical protein